MITHVNRYFEKETMIRNHNIITQKHSCMWHNVRIASIKYSFAKDYSLASEQKNWQR